MNTVAQSPARGYRTLRLPIAEADYEPFMNDNVFAKATLEQCYEQHPELFPPQWSSDYAPCGFTERSSKQQIRCRRCRLVANKTVWTVSPGLVLPYHSGRVDEVEKALFLMRFHVPC